ncbi:hypothetical protein HYS48_01420 [Candidatus Woesearchaeota archaeon]|nr:hypothetical protein [Candidatus Woesearchaeota archaeon]
MPLNKQFLEQRYVLPGIVAMMVLLFAFLAFYAGRGTAGRAFEQGGVTFCRCDVDFTVYDNADMQTETVANVVYFCKQEGVDCTTVCQQSCTGEGCIGCRVCNPIPDTDGDSLIDDLELTLQGKCPE